MNTTESLVPAQNGLLGLSFEGQNVRILERNGEPWFVAADLEKPLGIARIADSVYSLDDDQKSRLGVDSFGDLRANSSLVSESGLYELIFRSTKPEAKRLRKWVTSEVLPQIRRTGGYGSPAAAGLSKLETALVDLAREHDGRIAKLESQMIPGAGWMSIAEYGWQRGIGLRNGQLSFLAKRCLSETAKRQLPMGEDRSPSGDRRRTFSPEVLECCCPIIDRWVREGRAWELSETAQKGGQPA